MGSWGDRLLHPRCDRGVLLASEQPGIPSPLRWSFVASVMSIYQEQPCDYYYAKEEEDHPRLNILWWNYLPVPRRGFKQGSLIYERKSSFSYAPRWPSVRLAERRRISNVYSTLTLHSISVTCFWITGRHVNVLSVIGESSDPFAVLVQMRERGILSSFSFWRGDKKASRSGSVIWMIARGDLFGHADYAIKIPPLHILYRIPRPCQNAQMRGWKVANKTENRVSSWRLILWRSREAFAYFVPGNSSTS